jgi:hypothetical protein
LKEFFTFHGRRSSKVHRSHKHKSSCEDVSCETTHSAFPIHEKRRNSIPSFLLKHHKKRSKKSPGGLEDEHIGEGVQDTSESYPAINIIASDDAPSSSEVSSTSVENIASDRRSPVLLKANRSEENIPRAARFAETVSKVCFSSELMRKKTPGESKRSSQVDLLEVPKTSRSNSWSSADDDDPFGDKCEADMSMLQKLAFVSQPLQRAV